jgi:hypothetical protein
MLLRRGEIHQQQSSQSRPAEILRGDLRVPEFALTRKQVRRQCRVVHQQVGQYWRLDGFCENSELLDLEFLRDEQQIVRDENAGYRYRTLLLTRHVTN